MIYRDAKHKSIKIETDTSGGIVKESVIDSNLLNSCIEKISEYLDELIKNKTIQLKNSFSTEQQKELLSLTPCEASEYLYPKLFTKTKKMDCNHNRDRDYINSIIKDSGLSKKEFSKCFFMRKSDFNKLCTGTQLLTANQRGHLKALEFIIKQDLLNEFRKRIKSLSK